MFNGSLGKSLLRLGVLCLSTGTVFGFNLTITGTPAPKQVNVGTKINANGTYTYGAGDPALTSISAYFIHGAAAPPGFPNATVTGTITDSKTAYLYGTSTSGGSYSLQRTGMPDRRLTATKNGTNKTNYYVSAAGYGATSWYADASGNYANPSVSAYSFP